MSSADFHQHLALVTASIAGQAVGSELEARLNREHGAGSATFAQLKEDCLRGLAEGWLCEREAGGIRYGRVFKPSAELHNFSVDVVDMKDVVGPHHAHPNGEIDLIMPIDTDSEFDGRGAGWLVYAPGSAHHPTVARGRALVLYLLPEGRIEFTR
ncbi:4-hydroxylaminobenzoate lyase [Thiomonas sp.]